ncbi:Low molecular weight phosphotyrosine protein phosphatase [Tritrichomonas foetus]|uniref:Low molecular weight phosphotyrosine protein phosphatase n=1 Tax=Tritrichomonas foetus TaxID=1144522 RepID=A0A1J4JEW0_9EUKA|nr:Low molecular weight phosphotyrosine protein phosphatase [Tritrichomonas foetus]|eukprot:OHS97682.1 Low molecular weight phosphotyrosine protein phosphatase [Tritrichomonas foetus]
MVKYTNISIMKQLVLNFSPKGDIEAADPHVKPQSVMFVCLGNIIRSPLCEGLFRHLTNNQIFVDSSAVGSHDLGKHPAVFSQEIALENGFDISNHVSKLIKAKDFDVFDIIVSLDPSVFEKLRKMKPPNSKAKVIELIPRKYVLNPYLQGKRSFYKMFSEVKEGVNSLVINYFPEYIQKPDVQS